ncbi:hypothetical protein AB0L64_36220 [Kribbella sp. NPDC051936]|uniref:hypothetical protein n=1 Tax=Kribbella sp. NPDC051936 TaxID=3154946 RepID=UPI0034208A76
MQVKSPLQQLLFTTSLVQTSSSAGTAFVFVVPSGESQVYVLVSNKHVVAERGPGSFSLAERDSTDASGNTVKLGTRINFADEDLARHWTGHPDPNVDVSAMFLGPFINRAAAEGKQTFFRAIGEENFPSNSAAADLDPLEPVAFVGYPNALFDKVNLTPIARWGHIATPVALDYNGLPAFLIDASIFPGSSGSPVFIAQLNGYRENGTIHVGASRVMFAGLVASVHVQQDQAQLVTARPRHVVLNQLMDLGIVFNWRAVKETVQALYAAHGFTYGSDVRPSVAPPSVAVTEEEEPPLRPDDATGRS